MVILKVLSETTCLFIAPKLKGFVVVPHNQYSNQDIKTSVSLIAAVFLTKHTAELGLTWSQSHDMCRGGRADD